MDRTLLQIDDGNLGRYLWGSSHFSRHRGSDQDRRPSVPSSCESIPCVSDPVVSVLTFNSLCMCAYLMMLPGPL